MIKKHFTASEQVAMSALLELNRALIMGDGTLAFQSFPSDFLFDAFDEMITGKISENKDTDDGKIWRRHREIVFINTSKPFVVKVLLVSYPQRSEIWEVKEIVVGCPFFLSSKMWSLILTETLLWQQYFPNYRELFKNVVIGKHSMALTEKIFFSW